MQSGLPLDINPDWNLLRTFFVIVEERSITLAAQRLEVRQPTVTAALRRLEDSLGCQLIVRDSRHFQLTRHGEILQRETSDIYRGVIRIGEKLAGSERELSGLLRLLLVTCVRSPLIDEVIRLLHQRHPSVSVRIDVANSHEIVRTVGQKLAPVGICLLLKPIATLTCRLLFREDFAVVCGEEHPLHGKRGLTFAQLHDEAFVSFTCAGEGWGLEPMIALRDGMGLGSRVSGMSPHLDEVRRMIVAGMGIGILPLASVQSDLESGTLWRLPDPPGGTLGADLYLVMHPELQLGSLEQAFLEIIDDVISSDAE